MKRMAARASNAPSSPEIAASVTLSARSCRTIRTGLAPRAARMAISRARPTLRASERLATLAAAMRSTQETAAVSSHNANRGLDPTTWRLSGTTLIPRFRRRRHLLVETACDRAHLRLGLIDRHVRPQSPDDEPRTCAAHAATGLPIRKQRVRLPHIRIEARKLETCREDADDQRRTSVELDGRADRIVRASKTGLPEAMTDQGQALPLARPPRSRRCAPARAERRAMERSWVRSSRR